MKQFPYLIIPTLGFMLWVIMIILLSKHTILFYTVSAFILSFATTYLLLKLKDRAEPGQ